MPWPRPMRLLDKLFPEGALRDRRTRLGKGQASLPPGARRSVRQPGCSLRSGHRLLSAARTPQCRAPLQGSLAPGSAAFRGIYQPGRGAESDAAIRGRRDHPAARPPARSDARGGLFQSGGGLPQSGEGRAGHAGVPRGGAKLNPPWRDAQLNLSANLLLERNDKYPQAASAIMNWPSSCGRTGPR